MSGSALTLGRAKGAVLVGQGLSLTVPVQMEAQEGTSSLCFDADVFYGDVRQEASGVSVHSDALSQSQSATVTVTSRGAVNEPVVTVYLRGGCQSKTTRRYVLLAEPTTDAVQRPIAARSDLRSAPAKALPSIPAPFPAVVDSTVHLSIAKRAKAASKPQKIRDRRSHLTLAPLDLTPERDPVLALSSELSSEVSEDPQKRAQAAALWRALNATPQDVASAESRRLTLESDLKGLHDITVKNRQVLVELTRRLSDAESERYSNPLVYALLAAIAVLIFGIGYFRNRAPHGLAGVPWWRDGDAHDKSPDMGGGAVDQAASDTDHKVVGKKLDSSSVLTPNTQLEHSVQKQTHTEDI
ncbi:MAG: hypothetical protein ABIZ09_17385, partial [Rhodoferax sp.]